MQHDILPVEIHIRDGEQTVAIHWDDGHRSVYPWWYLRGFCPCAVCQGHQAGLQFVAAEAPHLTRMDEVGNYALNVVWDTQHTTGIYTFAALRRMCPCGACQTQFSDHPVTLLPAMRQAEFQRT